MSPQIKFIFLVPLFLAFINSSYAQSWQWAKVEAQTLGEGYSICSDLSGNCILAGVLQGTNTIGSTTYSSSGLKTGVLKYSPTGALMWHLVLDCGGICSIASDNSGAIYLSGTYTGSLVAGTNTVFAPSGVSAYLLKLNAAGNVQWLQNVGNASTIQVTALATDAAGNSVVTGYFSGLTISVGQTTYVNMGVGAAFVAKFNTSGTSQWADVLSCNGYGYPRPGGIALDAGGNVYATGTYSQQISSGSNSITSTGGTDIYLVRYNSAGLMQQLQSLGTTGFEAGVGLEVAPTGNIYLCGSLSGTLCGIGSNTFSSNGLSDAFIANLSNFFVVNWVNRLGGSGNDVGYSMAPHNTGVFLAASILSNTVSISSSNFYIGNSTDGMALAQFDNAGNYMMIDVLEGGGDDMMDICLDNACSLYLGGDLLTPTVNFGSIAVTHTTFETPFIAKLQVNINTPIVNVVGTFTICAGKSATLLAIGASSYSWTTGAQTNSVVISPSSSSYYTLTATSPGYSCPSVFEIPISVQPNPTISVVANPSIICANQISTLTASGANTYSWSSGGTGSVLVTGNVIATGYTVSGTIGLCKSSTSVPLLVNSLPQLSISVNPSVVCIGAEYTANASGASTYTWQNASTASSFTGIATSTTQFFVTGTDAQTSCTHSAAYSLIVDVCESLSEIMLEANVQVYPNPANSELTLYSNRSRNLSVYSGTGELIIIISLPAEKPVKMDLSSFPTGYYYIKDSQGKFNQALVISR